eukprot:6357487-Prymnesium_polylepis.2
MCHLRQLAHARVLRHHVQHLGHQEEGAAQVGRARVDDVDERARISADGVVDADVVANALWPSTHLARRELCREGARRRRADESFKDDVAVRLQPFARRNPLGPQPHQRLCKGPHLGRILAEGGRGAHGRTRPPLCRALEVAASAEKVHCRAVRVPRGSHPLRRHQLQPPSHQGEAIRRARGRLKALNAPSQLRHLGLASVTLGREARGQAAQLTAARKAKGTLQGRLPLFARRAVTAAAIMDGHLLALRNRRECVQSHRLQLLAPRRVGVGPAAVVEAAEPPADGGSARCVVHWQRVRLPLATDRLLRTQLLTQRPVCSSRLVAEPADGGLNLLAIALPAPCEQRRLGEHALCRLDRTQRKAPETQSTAPNAKSSSADRAGQLPK